MKKEIILLYGPEGTGKTTSIKRLLEKVIREWGIHEYYDYYRVCKKIDTENFKVPARDIKSIVLYRGNTIGFASGGDHPQIIERNFKFFEGKYCNKNCNICITACRTTKKEGPKKLIDKWVNEKGYKDSIIFKTNKTSQDNIDKMVDDVYRTLKQLTLRS